MYTTGIPVVFPDFNVHTDVARFLNFSLIQGPASRPRWFAVTAPVAGRSPARGAAPRTTTRAARHAPARMHTYAHAAPRRSNGTANGRARVNGA